MTSAPSSPPSGTQTADVLPAVALAADILPAVALTADILVVGGGPAGHAAAKEAARLGASVLLAERAHLGGTCLNVCCIPTKLLLGATNAVAELRGQTRHKTLAGELRPDLAGLMRRKDRLVAATRQAVARELADLGVALVAGDVRLTGPGQALAETADGPVAIAFSQAILATGTRPLVPPGMEPDGIRVLTSDQALSLTAVPESVVILGAGAIGLELGDWLDRMGARISMVEAQPRLAPLEDPEVGQTLAGLRKREGWRLHLGLRVEKIDRDDAGVTCRLSDGTAVQAAAALLALGRRPNSESLGLDAVGVAPDARGFVPVDDRLRAAPGVFAVGDLNGRALWAHAASHQARHAARLAHGATQAPYPFPAMPGCIYGSHEVLRAGLAGTQLQAAGRPYVVSAAPLAANPLAQAHGSTGGFIQCFWVDERLEGVLALGWNVSHLATLAQSLVSRRVRREEVESLIFAHPTLDESLEQALLAPRAAQKFLPNESL